MAGQRRTLKGARPKAPPPPDPERLSRASALSEAAPLPAEVGVARFGTAATMLVLLTPLHHFGIQVFGAWMPGRVAALAFPWLGAALGLAFLLAAERPPAVRVLGGALALLAVALISS